MWQQQIHKGGAMSVACKWTEVWREGRRNKLNYEVILTETSNIHNEDRRERIEFWKEENTFHWILLQRMLDE